MYKNKNGFAKEKFDDSYIEMTQDEIDFLNKYNGQGWIIADNMYQIQPEYERTLFNTLKKEKNELIDTKAYQYENQGLINYTAKAISGEMVNIQIETTKTNIGKINGLINLFEAGVITEYEWSTQDDTKIILKEDDCTKLSDLFAEFSKEIWIVKQPYFKSQLDKCNTTDEVNALEIDYSKYIQP